MAITSMASYPHIEINVIDESIYQYSNTRILPLQRDLFTVRAQKGRVGVLAWYDQYTEAETALGAETFNNLNPKYCSNDSIFIKRVMENNGCFIVRLAEPESLEKATDDFEHDGIIERKGSLKALQILEAVVKCGSDNTGVDVVQYERNDDGSIMTDGGGNRIERVLDKYGNHIPPYLLNEDGSRVNPNQESPDNGEWSTARDSGYYIAPGFANTVITSEHLGKYAVTNSAVIELTPENIATYIGKSYPLSASENGPFNTSVLTSDHIGSYVKDGNTVIKLTADNIATYAGQTLPLDTTENGDFNSTSVVANDLIGKYIKVYTTVELTDSNVDDYAGQTLPLSNTVDGLNATETTIYSDLIGKSVKDKNKIIKLTASNLKDYFGKSFLFGAENGSAGIETVKGMNIDWRWRYAFRPASVTQSERESIDKMDKEYSEAGKKVYPMLIFEASSPGCWGNDNCLEFFYDSSTNSRDEVQLLGNVIYTLKPHFKVYGGSSVNSYFDKRGNNAVNFVMEPDKIDARYESMVSLIDVLDDSYDESNPLPWNVTYCNKNWEKVTTLARKFEKRYYDAVYDNAPLQYIEIPGERTQLSDANISEFLGKYKYVLDDDTTTDGEFRTVVAADVGKYILDAIIANAPGDGLADSDTDGVAAVDTFFENGKKLSELELEGENLATFKEQTAFYNAVADYSSNWMMNIVSGINLDGVPYYTVQVNQLSYDNPSFNANIDNENYQNSDGTILRTYSQWAPAELVSDVLHYASNGRDGDLSDWGHEERIRSFYGLTYQYEDTWNPKNIVDRGRFPFNTIFDTGYTLETKKALCNFLTVREDVKIILSTQNCNQYLSATDGKTVMDPVLNTMAQDESVGTALQSRVQLMRESVVKGTACCRATIFAHAGYLYGTYKKIVPMTLWSAIRGSEHYNTVSMNGTCKGWPNSQVDIFKTLNWVAPDEASHERHWNLGINYVQYYDMDNLHFPSIRTVYKYDTSVLLDDEFTDAIVFVKQAARDSWATYVGMDTPQTIYEALITKDLSARLLQIFNGRYTFDVQAYQTVEEANRGYVQHVAITITSPAVKRVWLVDVICRREGFDPTAQANA